MSRGSSARALLLAWLPVALWMGLIFTASTDLGGTQRTSRILAPLLRWLVPDITPGTVDTIHLAARKTGHAAAYAILAGLIWRARRRHGPAEPPGSFQAGLRFAFLLAVAYAATDEWHQTYTSTRQGSLADVALDAAGAATGLAGIWWWRSRNPH